MLIYLIAIKTNSLIFYYPFLLKITYNSVRDNFKERLGGLKASRSAFKSLVDVISSKMNNSLFKSEFDKEYKKEIKRSSPRMRR